MVALRILHAWLIVDEFGAPRLDPLGRHLSFSDYAVAKNFAVGKERVVSSKIEFEQEDAQLRPVQTFSVPSKSGV